MVKSTFAHRCRTLTFATGVCLGLAGVRLVAHALSGADVATLVNQRYQSTVSRCGLKSAAWQCSGVLMRAPPADALHHFAGVPAEERALTSTQRRKRHEKTAGPITGQAVIPSMPRCTGATTLPLATQPIGVALIG
ncbi:hypothetical protein PAN31108_00303 [Pandoraea anhela]|uniref:Uncharacterized protein n=1 Tax=Pandoraea anhela TaxID=2508295 RepID=A0A5E4RNB8_9BURK|nr:hypothetical protein PAN31108_00303 [Pandoraea anhela]